MRRRRFFDNLTLPQRPLIPEWHLQQQKIFLPALLLPAPSATLSLNSIGKRGCPRKQTLPRIPLGAGVSTGLRRTSRRVHFRLRLKCRIETVQENPPGFPAHTLSPRRQHSPVSHWEPVFPPAPYIKSGGINPGADAAGHVSGDAQAACAILCVTAAACHEARPPLPSHRRKKY